MTTAGRILIIPKGDYNPENEYEMLDLVKYNGTSWLAKQNSIGKEPSAENEDYWQKMFDIEDFVDSRIESAVARYMASKGM